MRLPRLLLAASVAVAAVISALGATAPAQAVPTTYYLALGDSLSVGYQPGQGDTSQGYTDDLYSNLRARVGNSGLQLVKLGCSGETTTSMINGGVCGEGRYTTGSQLGDAEAFLATHRAAVKYLTIDIGANDVDGCAPGGSIDAVCIAKGAATIAQNLNTILNGLRTADAHTLPQSAGMTYYDPFLEYWLTGTQGQAVAIASVGALAGINSTEVAEYSLYGIKEADVFSAFHSSDFIDQTTVAPYGSLPLNVATICRLTYMCSLKNIHANPAGYQLIANTFAARLD